MEVNENNIKNVAIYLRKSRDEGESADVLSKHRDVLTEMATRSGWKYEIYEEVASGAEIVYRPEMQRLLDDVNVGNYEAVLVMDIDRLSRGETRDWAAIYESFKNKYSNTLIITPNKVYNLAEEGDEMSVDIQAFIAKYERRTIIRRFKRGKVGGARQGNWTNGSPPYPYEYNKNTKKIEPNPDKVPIYRKIIESYLGGMSTRDIVVWLNKNKIQMPTGATPSGKKIGWAQNTVTRILKSEVHLGKVVYGKTEGSSSKREKTVDKPKKDWIYSKEGATTHTALKTQEEHDRILVLMQQNNCVPVRARAGTTPLSGLIFCKQCGHSIKLSKNRGGKNGEDIHYIAQCRFTFKDGSKCPQKGKKCDQEFWDALFNNIISIDDNKLKEIETQTKRKAELKILLNAKQQDSEKTNTALDRIFDLYENGVISKDQFLTRKEMRDKEKGQLQKEIKTLQLELKHLRGMSKEELAELISAFKDNWKNALTDKQKNDALKSIVKKIVYDRDVEKNEIVLEIEYL